MTAATATRSKASGKPIRWRRIGVIDVGSNSVRLVVYDVRGRAMQPRFNEKVLAGLGKGLNGSGKLNREGIDMTLAALSRRQGVRGADQERDRHHAARALRRR
jgi:exopolyphosphatase/guanosine-5'-triphosphate,3'-diphosphate pyrophosphatase